MNRVKTWVNILRSCFSTLYIGNSKLVICSVYIISYSLKELFLAKFMTRYICEIINYSVWCFPRGVKMLLKRFTVMCDILLFVLYTEEAKELCRF